MTGQRIFMLTLMAKPDGPDPYHGIRALLKIALRRYGLRCVQAREIAPPLQPERTQAHDHNLHPSRSRTERQPDRQGDGRG